MLTPGEATTLKFLAGFICGFGTGASLVWVAMKERLRNG